MNIKKPSIRWLWGAAVALVTGGAVDYFAFPYGAAPPAVSGDRGENGLWVRYPFYFGQKTPAERQALYQRLRENGIRDAYFHVRSIQRDGSLKYRYPEAARTLVTELHRAAPGCRARAWIYAGNPSGQGDVDLANPSVRRRMVAEALWLCTVCGFDGVQWDYEICNSGDPYLVQLLDETRAALPQGKILSVATGAWSPLPGRLGWSSDYFAQLAAHCDQLAVMCYDSGMVVPRAYFAFTAANVAQITHAVAQGNPQCRVLIGVPTYGTGLPSHNPRAENLDLALRGVRAGLADSQAAPTVFAGVALFADYTTDAGEWATYRELWHRP